MVETIQECKSCNGMKKGTVERRLMKGYARLCPECLENLKWTSKVLEVGTDWYIKKFGKNYVKFSKFSVTPLDSQIYDKMSCFTYYIGIKGVTENTTPYGYGTITLRRSCHHEP